MDIIITWNCTKFYKLLYLEICKMKIVKRTDELNRITHKV